MDAKCPWSRAAGSYTKRRGSSPLTPLFGLIWDIVGIFGVKGMMEQMKTTVSGLGLRDMIPTMENRLQKKIDNEMETGCNILACAGIRGSH